MNTHILGEPRFASTLSHTISDDVRIPERIEVGAEPGIMFELAGPRAKLFFDPKDKVICLLLEAYDSFLSVEVKNTKKVRKRTNRVVAGIIASDGSPNRTRLG